MVTALQRGRGGGPDLTVRVIIVLAAPDRIRTRAGPPGPPVTLDAAFDTSVRRIS